MKKISNSCHMKNQVLSEKAETVLFEIDLITVELSTRVKIVFLWMIIQQSEVRRGQAMLRH